MLFHSLPALFFFVAAVTMLLGCDEMGNVKPTDRSHFSFAGADAADTTGVWFQTSPKVQKLQSLIREGVDLEVENEEGETALVYFARCQSQADTGATEFGTLCDILIDNGAHVHHSACLYLDRIAHSEIDNYVKEHVSISQLDPLLELAVSLLARRWCEVLLANGADPNLRDACGVPILCLATNDPQIVNAFINASADVNIAVKYECNIGGLILYGEGSTPVHYAAHNGRIQSIDLLLSSGADLNAMDHWFGWTPLHHAAMTLRPDTIRFLLKKGAAHDRRDSEERRPRDILVAGPHYVDLYDERFVEDPRGEAKAIASYEAAALVVFDAFEGNRVQPE